MQDVIDRFAKQAPAALMFRSMFGRLFSDESLDEIFSKHRQRQLESEVLFSSLVRLLTPVVTGSTASVNASYQVSDFEVSSQAVYQKLKGVEPEVSAALVRATVEQLRRIQKGVCHDDIVPGYHTFVIDGKSLDGTQHRLKESRTDSRSPLPGRSIAMLDTRYKLFVDVEYDANAHRCERKIFEPMMNRLEEGALYLADRNFSDGPVLASFIQAKAFFVVRQHGACPSWRACSGKVRHSKSADGNGGRVSEQEIEIQLPNGSWHRVRQVTVDLKKATRKGDKTLRLLTNLPRSVSAIKIADSYRQRWTIETCLGYLAQALNAEINTLCYPAAAGLCFCLALTLFNIISTISALLKYHGKQPNSSQEIEISYYYVAHEIAQCQAGMQITIRDDYWKRYAKMTHPQFARFLREVAQNALLKRYRKHPRGPKKPKPKRKFNGARHVATQKLIAARMTA